MKRLLIALLIVAAVAGAAFASAATLNLNAGTAQAGEDAVLSCQTAPIIVESWAVNTYPEAEGVGYVSVRNISPACNGARIMGRVQYTNGFAYTSGVNENGVGEYFVVANGNENTVYTLFLKDRSFANQLYIPMEQIQGLKLWLEGSTN